MEYIMLIMLAVLVLLFCVFNMRNYVVCEIRIGVLNGSQSGLDIHYSLPTYNYMLFNPTQWFMWTTKQYIKKYASHL